MPKTAKQNEPENTITRQDLRLVSLWAASILIFYALVCYFAVGALRGYKAEAERNFHARVREATEERNASSTDVKPVRVMVGIYICRIADFSIKDAVWEADFDIWFRWTGDKIDPGNTFRLANGEIDSKERREAYTYRLQHYERYHVRAHITKYFDASRFPFGGTGLPIEVEDGMNDVSRLRYVADRQSNGFSREGIPPALHVMQWLGGVDEDAYGSSFGSPRVPVGTSSVHSRYIFGMVVHPPSGRLFLTMFVALFAAVLISLIAASIRPIHEDGRFGLGIGAFFAAVGNSFTVNTIIPQSNQLTLTSMVNGIGLFTIGLTIAQSIISLHLYELGKDRLSVLFDKVSFIVLLLAYAATSILLPLAAN